MFNAKLRKNAIDNYNASVERYEMVASNLNTDTTLLYLEREETVTVIKLVEERINQLVNSPKEFEVSIKKIEFEVKQFNEKKQEIKKAETEVKVAAGSFGTGVSLSALGVAVATMGPTTTISIATTFGVASTGTAISTLSGAAATNAALAWIGGGTLAVGGGGMSAGSAFLAFAGPVGWTIAGLMLAGSVGSGLFASYKNKKVAKDQIRERENLEKIIRKFNLMTSEVKALTEITISQRIEVANLEKSLSGNNYSEFSKEEKIQAGLLVNSALTLVQLVNKELKLND